MLFILLGKQVKFISFPHLHPSSPSPRLKGCNLTLSHRELWTTCNFHVTLQKLKFFLSWEAEQELFAGMYLSRWWHFTHWKWRGMNSFISCTYLISIYFNIFTFIEFKKTYIKICCTYLTLSDDVVVDTTSCYYS